MKKNYKTVLLGISFSMMFFYGCGKKPIEEVSLEKVDIVDNLIIDMENDKEIYKYIDKGNLVSLNLEAHGKLRAYSEKADVAVFLEYSENGKKINIRSNDEIKSFFVSGDISFINISSDGDYIFLKTTTDNISEYKIVDRHNLSSVNISDNIAISGDLIRFLDNDNLIFYGVYMDNNDCGIFSYNIKDRSYKLLKEIKEKFVNYIDVLSDSEILIGQVIDGQNKIALLDLNTLEEEILCDGFENIDTSVIYEGDIYMSAFENGNYNLYRVDINSKSIKRLTYGFPKSLGRESGFVIEENKIYFSDITGKLYFYDIKSESTNILENQIGMNMIVDK
ncbi:hypothetical protein [uncultured Clostridium sp.]|uniref:hypothetical protein n=1 Tax=uncultured Clostridium sp. TaxID=59620 RepID=UPI00262F78F0|nr:hypothetical protein [uncultured Clostridium sp.]